MQTITLSEAAVALLKRYMESGDIPVDDSNRATCRELAAAGLMVAGHTFTGGREVFYRCTEAGWKLANAPSRRIRLAPSVIGRSDFGAALIAASCVMCRSSSNSWAMTASILSRRRAFAHGLPPFLPFNRSGLSTPELTVIPVVMLPPTVPSESKVCHAMRDMGQLPRSCPSALPALSCAAGRRFQPRPASLGQISQRAPPGPPEWRGVRWRRADHGRWWFVGIVGHPMIVSQSSAVSDHFSVQARYHPYRDPVRSI